MLNSKSAAWADWLADMVLEDVTEMYVEAAEAVSTL
jgi:hypothetical protein